MNQATNVLYARKRHAKEVKISLEQNHLLDKKFRMTKVDPDSFSSCCFLTTSNSTTSNTNATTLNNETISHLDCIAMPIVEECLSLVKNLDDNNNVVMEYGKNKKSTSDFIEFIIGYGTQSCPYSTALLGNTTCSRNNNITLNKSNINNLHGSNHERNIIRQVLIETFTEETTNYHQQTKQDDTSYDIDSHMNMIQIMEEEVDKLSIKTCPKKLEILGDDHTLVLSYKALNVQTDEEYKELVQNYVCSIQDVNSVGTHGHEEKRSETNNATDKHLVNDFEITLWSKLANIYNSKRVVRRGEIDPNSKIRESGHTLLWLATEREIQNEEDEIKEDPESSKGWITITEQGIKQSFDLTKVMFSRGNISEKIRFGKKLVKDGEIVLDMYAGIGYYTLPALIHGNAKFVYACEWNPNAASYLRYNLKQNGVQGRAVVLEGDTRIRLKEENVFDNIRFDRISLGLLPSSEGGWKVAVQALNHQQGGWLHIHGNVPVNEKKQWVFWICRRLADIYLELWSDHENVFQSPIVLCHHLERVKSFAPKVDHLVADVFIGSVNTNLPSDFDGIDMNEYKIGFFDENNFCPCPDVVEAPSCALVSGVLNQEWMMENKE